MLGTITFFSGLLFWLFFLAALATPLSEFAATSFLPYALVLAVGTVAGLFFLIRNRFLATWFPALICPYCQQQTALVNYWYCVGGCNARKARHVLSPCPTCGTKLQGLACSNYYCGQAISFQEPYNEFEIANRGKKYVTQYNPFFWIPVLALEFCLLLLYVSFQGGFLILCGLFGLLSVALVATLIIIRPKRLIRNQYYIEGAEQWTRSADEVRIRQDMQRLAGTPGLAKYIAVLKGRFSRAAERAALEQWEKFYMSAQKTVQAHTELVRAQHDHQQVEREYEIKNKQKDLASLSLDADIEEQRLRLELARAARRELEQGVNQPSASARWSEEAAMLDQWYQQACRLIMEDHTLSLDEQDYLLEQLKAEYRARKQTIDLG